MRVPGPFRSLPRPSSPAEAKASSVRPNFSSSVNLCVCEIASTFISLYWLIYIILHLPRCNLSVLSMIFSAGFRGGGPVYYKKDLRKHNTPRTRPCARASICRSKPQKGGVPATPSGTATLLRLSPSYHVRPRPLLSVTDFRRPRLPWLDGRCVQGPGTYSPRHG